MNTPNITSKDDPVIFLYRTILGFKPLNGIKVQNQASPFYACEHITLPMEEVIAVGFGNALLTKNNECIYSEIEARSCDDYMTVAQAEVLAAQDPNHDWRIHLVAPFSERHYQRQGECYWVLYEKGEGFA